MYHLLANTPALSRPGSSSSPFESFPVILSPSESVRVLLSSPWSDSVREGTSMLVPVATGTSQQSGRRTPPNPSHSESLRVNTMSLPVRNKEPECRALPPRSRSLSITNPKDINYSLPHAHTLGSNESPAGPPALVRCVCVCVCARARARVCACVNASLRARVPAPHPCASAPVRALFVCAHA